MNVLVLYYFFFYIGMVKRPIGQFSLCK